MQTAKYGHEVEKFVMFLCGWIALVVYVCCFSTAPRSFNPLSARVIKCGQMGES